jgi:hypothetical protein
MRYSMKVLSALLLMVLAFNAAGCSKLFGPSNDDILKAINDSGTFKSSGFTVTSPITIVEKGDKRSDGSWPVKVKFKLSFMYTKDGVTAPRESETTTTVYLSKSKDASGKTVWVARLN